MSPTTSSAVCLQLKHSSEGSGRGGDWALRITANKSQQLLNKEAAAAAAAEGGGSSSQKQRRCSLILYMTDSDWAQADMDMWPDGSSSKLQQVSASAEVTITSLCVLALFIRSARVQASTFNAALPSAGASPGVSSRC